MLLNEVMNQIVRQVIHRSSCLLIFACTTNDDGLVSYSRTFFIAIFSKEEDKKSQSVLLLSIFQYHLTSSVPA